MAEEPGTITEVFQNHITEHAARCDGIIVNWTRATLRATGAIMDAIQSEALQDPPVRTTRDKVRAMDKTQLLFLKQKVKGLHDAIVEALKVGA